MQNISKQNNFTIENQHQNCVFSLKTSADQCNEKKSGLLAKCAPGIADTAGDNDFARWPMKTSSFTDFDSQVESQCKPLSTKAALCCATPEKCIKEAIGGMGGASAQFAIQALQFIGTGAIAISAGGGAAKICETTGAVAAGGAALSTAMAGLCGKKVDQCVKTCGNIKDDIESAIASCSSGKSEPSQINACRDMYKDALKRANNHINDCQRADVATVEKGASAMGALMAAKMADYCKQQTTAGTTPGLQQNLFNIDCTSAGAATNPICQNPCMRDATSQECMNQIAAMGQNPNGGMGGPGGANSDLDMNGINAPLPPLAESPDPMGTPATNNGLATVQGGGGGANLGGGDGMLGGAPGAPGGGADSGIPSGIIQGQKSGSGYTPSYARAGGSGGYSSSGRGVASEPRDGSGFNLKQYLPGGKLSGKRNLANLTGHPEIAPKTSNLFQLISQRYREICLKDRLYECDKLFKKPRN